MTAVLRDLRPVRVVGVGLHPYQRASQTPYTALGVRAVREALADSGLGWPAVQAAYTATALLPMAISRLMYRHLGSTGLPVLQVENASASGSSAFRQACLDVASGVYDVVIAVGVDKPAPPAMPFAAAGVVDLVGKFNSPVGHFALLANRYLHEHGATAEQIAQVAVKNAANGALNPYAQRRKPRGLEEVLASGRIAGALTRLQCCPVGEGAAAAIVASDDAISRLSLDRTRAVRVVASAAGSERAHSVADADTVLTRDTTHRLYEEAGSGPADIDLVELHDAFTVEELLYLEAMDISETGDAARRVGHGDFNIGGQVAVNTSGGLLSMGHPIGPTGIGQVREIVTQLRHEAGDRQHPNARVGLTHMVGIGAVCVMHMLTAPSLS